MFESMIPFFSGPLMSISMDAVAWALIHFLWQGTLVALVLRSLLAGLPDQLSNWRYGLSLTALLMMAVLPMATAHHHVRSTSGAPSVTATSPDVSTSAAVAPSPEFQVVSASGAVLPQGGEEARPAGIPVMLTQLRAELQPRLPWVLGCWLLGVAFFGFQQAVAWRRVQALVRGAGDAEPQLQAMLGHLADRLGIQQSVQVLSSHAIDVPTVVGMLKPVVLVPLGTLTRLSGEQVEMILAHELAHVRRHDFAVNLLQTAIETLLFYHPAVWWVSAQVRREREHCCDDIAVHLLGDQRGYARALLELEETRAPSLAMAANGTPLLDRVRRLVGSSDTGQDSLGSTALAGVLSLTLLAMVLGLAHPVWGGDVPTLPVAPAPIAPNGPAPTAAEAPPAPSSPEAPRSPDMPSVVAPPAPAPAPRPTPPVAAPGVPSPALLTVPMVLDSHGNEGLRTRGRFQLERRWGQVSLQMRGDTASRFNLHTSVELADFSETQWTASGRAVLKREAGDLIFEGDFTAPGEGKGYYRFEPSAAFRSAMAKRGYDDLTDERQFELSLFEVGPRQVDDLASLGFEDLSLQRLIELSIHDVDGDFIRSFRSVGYEDLDLQTWIEFAIHDVTPSFVEAMVDMGYSDLPGQRLVELQIHDVDPDFIRQVHSMGFVDVSIQKLIELSIHDVDPDYMQAMADAGYRDLPLQKLIEFAIHDVDPGFVQAMADAGYDDLPAQRIVEFAIHDVDPRFVQALADAGYDDLPPKSILEFAIHDVDPRLIQALSDAGYRDLPPQRLVEFAVHDIDPDFVTALADLGYRDLPASRMVEFAVHDVTPRFIRDLADLGYRDLSVQQLVEFRIFDVTPGYVRRLQQNGQQLTPKELVERRIHGK